MLKTCPACGGVGERFDHLPGWCKGCDGTGMRDQHWVEIAHDIGPRIITDGHGGLGPCTCRGCYAMGCDNCARLGCVRHFDDLNPHHGNLVLPIEWLVNDPRTEEKMKQLREA